MNVQQLVSLIKKLTGDNFLMKAAVVLVHRQGGETITGVPIPLENTRNVLDELKRIRASFSVKFNRVSVIVRLAKDHRPIVSAVFDKVSNLLIRFKAKVTFVNPTTSIDAHLQLQDKESSRAFLVLTITKRKKEDQPDAYLPVDGQ